MRAVTLVALSDDGRYVASAAERVVRVAAVADGRVTGGAASRRRRDGAGVRAGLARRSPSATRPAPSCICAGSRPARERATRAARCRRRRRWHSRPTAAGSPRRTRAARSRCSRTAAGNVEGTARHWSQPIRWLEFSPTAARLLVATDAWLHALAATTPALAPVAQQARRVARVEHGADGDFGHCGGLRRRRGRRLARVGRARSRGGADAARPTPRRSSRATGPPRSRCGLTIMASPCRSIRNEAAQAAARAKLFCVEFVN